MSLQSIMLSRINLSIKVERIIQNVKDEIIRKLEPLSHFPNPEEIKNIIFKLFKTNMISMLCFSYLPVDKLKNIIKIYFIMVMFGVDSCILKFKINGKFNKPINSIPQMNNSLLPLVYAGANMNMFLNLVRMICGEKGHEFIQKISTDIMLLNYNFLKRDWSDLESIFGDYIDLSIFDPLNESLNDDILPETRYFNCYEFILSKTENEVMINNRFLSMLTLCFNENDNLEKKYSYVLLLDDYRFMSVIFSHMKISKINILADEIDNEFYSCANIIEEESVIMYSRHRLLSQKNILTLIENVRYTIENS